MQEEGIFARVATGATDRGSGRVLGHGVAAGLGCGMKRGAMLETRGCKKYCVNGRRGIEVRDPIGGMTWPLPKTCLTN